MTDADGEQGRGGRELTDYPFAHIVLHLWNVVYAAAFLALIGYYGAFEIAVYFGFGLVIANLENS